MRPATPVPTTSLPSWVAQDGVRRDRRPSNVCHRGNRSDKPHLSRTQGLISPAWFGRAVLELPVPDPMSVLYGALWSRPWTRLHYLIVRTPPTAVHVLDDR
jgi:hypothetical protein